MGLASGESVSAQKERVTGVTADTRVGWYTQAREKPSCPQPHPCMEGREYMDGHPEGGNPRGYLRNLPATRITTDKLRVPILNGSVWTACSLKSQIRQECP